MIVAISQSTQASEMFSIVSDIKKKKLAIMIRMQLLLHKETLSTMQIIITIIIIIK